MCVWFIDYFQTGKDLPASLPEQKNRPSLFECGQQKNVQRPIGNMLMMNDCQPYSSLPKCKDKPPIPKIDHTAPQNTLYDSEMEITVNDGVADIVTVQTKPRKNCTDDLRSTTEDSRQSVVSIYDKAAVESSGQKDTTANTYMQTSCRTHLQTSTHTLTSSNDEESLPQQVELLHEEDESVTARRKTHVTSRNKKSNRRLNSQKHNTGNTRQTYVIPPHESSFISTTDDLDDYFCDQAVQSQRKSKGTLFDLNISKDSTESEAEMLKAQNNSTASRKTYEKPHSRKAKASSCSTDQKVMGGSEIIDVHTDGKEISVKRQSKHSTQSLSLTEQCNTLRHRETYVIHTGQMSAGSDSLNHTLDIHANVTSEETTNAVTLVSTHDVQCTSGMIQGQQAEQEVSHMHENRGAVCDEYRSEESSNHSPIWHTKAKKPKTMVIKERKKKFATEENVPGKRRPKFSSTEISDILPKEFSVPGNNNKKNSTSSNVLQEVTESLHSSALKKAFMDEPVIETGDTNSTHVRQSEHHNDLIEKYSDIVRNVKDLNIQNHKSKCRDTYVVLSSGNSQLKGKENIQVFNSNEDGFIANKESGIASVANGTFVSRKATNSQLIPRKAEQNHSELFSEDRPPWECLDFGFTESFTHDNPDSPVTTQKDSQNISLHIMDIYEEPGCNVSNQPPGN